MESSSLPHLRLLCSRAVVSMIDFRRVALVGTTFSSESDFRLFGAILVDVSLELRGGFMPRPAIGAPRIASVGRIHAWQNALKTSSDTPVLRNCVFANVT